MRIVNRWGTMSIILKSTFVALAVACLLLPGNRLLMADTVSSGKSGEVHIVVKGDTLWALSERYLSTPFMWPKLWQWNDHITNPHFIYPGDRINVVPPLVKVKRPVLVPVVEEPVVEVEPVVERPPGKKPFKPRRYKITELKSTGLVTGEDLKKAGKIIDAFDEKVLLSTGDVIYVGITGEAKKGDIYTVFRTTHEVFHPVKKEKRMMGVEREISVGFMIEVLGRIKIQSFSKNLATAKIIESFDAMERDDLVKPADKIPEEVTTIPLEIALEGYIVAAKDDQQIFGQDDVVYIDLGEKKGVQVGNTFIIYKQGETFVDEVKEGSDPTTEKDAAGEVAYELPSTTIGKLLVIDVREETSTAIILKSAENMASGERIKTETP